jgi:hypothetical protein
MADGSGGSGTAGGGTVAGKKTKSKKNPEPVDTNKLLEQTMARLERDAAGDREQELEIGKSVAPC